MKKNILITKNSLETLIENVLKEQYDPEKLYLRDFIVRRLERGPRELKKYIDKLPVIVRKDDQNNTIVLTKIPEVIYVFLSGRY